MNILSSRIREEREYGQLLENLSVQMKIENRAPIMVTGLCEGARNAFLAALVCEKITSSPALIVAHDEKTANIINAFLSGVGLRSMVYPVRDPVLYNIVSSHDTEHERIAVLTAIAKDDVDVVVTVPDAALQYTIPRGRLEKATMTLSEGESADIGELAKFLVSAGYVREALVDGKGQFSVRGGILDIFPPQLSSPVRIEFFGDDIDSIYSFDLMTQRRTSDIGKVTVTCAREILIDENARAKMSSVISAQLKKNIPAEARESLMHEKDAVDAGLEIAFSDKYISLIYPECTALIDWFCEDTLVVMTESSSVEERLKAYVWHYEETVKELISSGVMISRYSAFSEDAEDFYSFVQRNPAVLVNSFVSQYRERISGIYSFESRKTASPTENYAALVEDVSGYVTAGASILILCENEVEINNLVKLLGDGGISVAAASDFMKIKDIPRRCAYISCFDAEGFELIRSRFACISLRENQSLAKRKLTVRKLKNARSARSAKEKILSYADLEVGDYVVHVTHGIGRYMGLESIRNYDGVCRDHMKIQYAGTDVLYVPCEQIDLVSKYIGARADDGMLHLSKLGGTEWSRAKSKVKAEVKEMAKELIELYAERLRRPGYAFPKDGEMQREFESTFEYDETDGQLAAAEDIKSDMERSVPMDRLLCGDVGFGKTEVALRAAFKAVEAGKQVAILVPTTILAMQHYQTAISRMRAFPIKISLLSRFRTSKEQEATLRALKRGDVDIIIGTHRLLSSDVQFKDLGLLIVDEEQRFGVAHKEKLKQFSKNVDVLTLTATPIPRTLNMAMSSIRDMSVLDEAPSDRLPVQTYVLEHDDIVINEAIRRELRRGGQVFYLHNRVDTIVQKAMRLRNEFPDAVIETAHGQMEKEELSAIWQGMVSGDIDILVCTTIIETGVDVPNANTLIIENADKMGLSQLHQIRGRVGRSSRRAYAYFTYPHSKSLSEIATKRLQAIRDFTEFGSGFKIALRDLEIRGAGDLLGARQHGHMESIGYDLYIKILNEAVLEEKGEKPKERADCTVNIGRDSYIPESYIEDPAQRIDVYKKIATVETEQDMDDIAAELLDRYGDLPPSVETLLSISLLRALAIDCAFVQIDQTEDGAVIYPRYLDIAAWSEMIALYPKKSITVIASAKPSVRCKNKSGEPILPFICGLLKKYIQIKSKKE